MLRKVDGTALTTGDLLRLARSKGMDISQELERIIRELEDSAFYTYYLTGSFSCETSTPNDLDFFCASTSEVSSSLARHGFKSDMGLYAEETFAKIYRYTPRNFFWKDVEHIDIQLVHPYIMDRKICAQGLYERVSPFLGELCDTDRKELWKILMTTARRITG